MGENVVDIVDEGDDDLSILNGNASPKPNVKNPINVCLDVNNNEN